MLYAVKNENNNVMVDLKQDTKQFSFECKLLMMHKYIDIAFIDPSVNLIEKFGKYAYQIDSLENLKSGKVKFEVFKLKFGLDRCYMYNRCCS